MFAALSNGRRRVEADSHAGGAMSSAFFDIHRNITGRAPPRGTQNNPRITQLTATIRAVEPGSGNRKK
jgi:hypothetical protein